MGPKKDATDAINVEKVESLSVKADKNMNSHRNDIEKIRVAVFDHLKASNNDMLEKLRSRMKIS